MLRRMVRDNRTRNNNVEHTLKAWHSVRKGEEKYIFPYQDVYKRQASGCIKKLTDDPEGLDYQKLECVCKHYKIWKKGTESILDGYGQGEYYDPQLSIIGGGTSQTFETERGRR